MSCWLEKGKNISVTDARILFPILYSHIKQFLFINIHSILIKYLEIELFDGV